MIIQTGQLAPEFSLYNTEKQLIQLSGYKGKNVLLFFFPFAFSSVCTAELCSVRDNISIFNDAEAVVLGISVDSLYSLGAFKKAQQLNFSLLSDFNKEVSATYGCLYESFNYNMKGVSKRAAFAIDKEGMVAYAEVLENAGTQPDFEAIKAALSELA